ncbi:hypothetical protein ACFLU5_16940 [Bacteroidota bacterium]
MIKNYHSSDIHECLLMNIVLNTELSFNDKTYDINEYDVQSLISTFLRRNIDNSKFTILRESHGKYDCLILDKEKKSPLILYEIKTFLKPRENLTNTAYGKVLKDFLKLKKGITDFSGSRAYFILVCRHAKIRNAIDDFAFIKKHQNGDKSFTTLKEKKITLRLRPSRKIIIERVTAYSWEIL